MHGAVSPSKLLKASRITLTIRPFSSPLNEIIEDIVILNSVSLVQYHYQNKKQRKRVLFKEMLNNLTMWVEETSKLPWLIWILICLFFLPSIDFGTEIELWISEKPCNSLCLVWWKVCVLQNIILWCFGNCFYWTYGLIKLNREYSWKFLPRFVLRKNINI